MGRTAARLTKKRENHNRGWKINRRKDMLLAPKSQKQDYRFGRFPATWVDHVNRLTGNLHIVPM